MMAQPYVRVRDLEASYHVPSGELRAVDGVDLVIERGRTLGIVGESGCGKSTLGLALMRLLPSNGRWSVGEFSLDGESLASMSDEAFRRQVRWKRLAMIFQTAMASLNPVLRVGDQLASAYRLHHAGASSAQARDRVVELFEMVGLPPARLRGYPHEFSGGMRQRAVIALSLVAEPEFIIADEATTALDVVVQQEILAALGDLQTTLGLTMAVVSHDMGVIANVCDDVAVMYAGRIVEVGSVSQVLGSPSHPYTAALVGALPSLDGPVRRLASLEGTPPDLVSPPSGCRFAARCPIARERCRQAPSLRSHTHRRVRCHFPDEVRTLGRTP